MPDACEHHGQAQFIGLGDDLLVLHRTAGVNHGRDAMAGGFEPLRPSLDGVVLATTHSLAKVTFNDCTIEFASAPGVAYLVQSDGGSVSFRGGKATGRYKISAGFSGEVEAVSADISPTVLEGDGAKKIRGVKVAPTAGPPSPE